MTWHFCIPLITFVVAYWKILGVIRHHAKVSTTGRQGIAVAAKEPTAGTSAGNTIETHIESTADKNPKDRGDNKEMAAVVSRGNRRGGGQKAPKTGVSRAQINVVTTMVFITVCFTICWMPMYVNIAMTQIAVKYSCSVLLVFSSG